MTAQDKTFFKYVGIYILIGLLVFGWNMNHTVPRVCATPNTEQCEDALSTTFFASVLWPIYIAGKVAIFVTRWP